MTIQVLHVARQPLTGVWSVMRELATWQLRSGYRVGLGLAVTRNWPDHYWAQLRQLRNDGVKIYVAASPDIPGTAAFMYHQMRNCVGDWSLEFGEVNTTVNLHSHNAWLSGAYFPVCNPNARLTVTYHGIQGERMLRKQPFRRLIHRYWAQRLVRASAAHVSVDVANTHVAHDLLGVPQDLFVVIPNGTSGPDLGKGGCPYLRDTSLPFTVGHVGVLDEGKGWRITAEAVAALRAKGISVRLMIAGSGPDSAKARDWCRQSDIDVFIGHTSDPQRDVFPHLDLLSLPSISEGLPMAVLEALSYSIPVVATAVGGLPNALTSGRDGFLVPRGSEEIASCTRELMARDVLANFSKAARDKFEAKFSIEAMGLAYHNVYSDLART